MCIYLGDGNCSYMNRTMVWWSVITFSNGCCLATGQLRPLRVKIMIKLILKTLIAVLKWLRSVLHKDDDARVTAIERLIRCLEWILSKEVWVRIVVNTLLHISLSEYHRELAFSCANFILDTLAIVL